MLGIDTRQYDMLKKAHLTLADLKLFSAFHEKEIGTFNLCLLYFGPKNGFKNNKSLDGLTGRTRGSISVFITYVYAMCVPLLKREEWR